MLVPMLALCALLNGEPDTKRCVFVEHTKNHAESISECKNIMDKTRKNPKVLNRASYELSLNFQYSGPMGYVMYCPNESDLQDFIKHFKIPDNSTVDVEV